MFDGDPTLLPSGQNLPVEVPKLTLSSTDERWRLQIGTSRAEVMWQRSDDSLTISAEEFADVSTRTLREYLSSSEELVVSRMAFVTRRFALISNPASEIASYFFRDAVLQGPLSRPNEIQLNAHKVYSPAGMPTLNSWVKWRNGYVKQSGQTVVTVEHDLNTLAEPSQVFGLSDISDFLTRAPREANSILAYYLSFPRQSN